MIGRNFKKRPRQTWNWPVGGGLDSTTFSNPGENKYSLFRGQSNIRVSSIFALHAVNKGSIPSIPYGPHLK